MERIETERLVLRRPSFADADAIFSRYASDAEVTRYLCWPTHRTLEDTRAFISLADAAWERHGAGPLLAFSRDDDVLVGSGGLDLAPPDEASAGYALAQDAWGRGLATELLRAMIALARERGVVRLGALCHPAHAASARVLEKCGFVRGAVLRGAVVFPNLSPGSGDGARGDALSFSLDLRGDDRKQGGV